jgi:hypothetical protein
MYIIIGVIFLISLITLSLAGISHGEVKNMISNPNLKYYYDDNQRLYLEFPVSWIEEEDQSNSVLLSGDGASLEIFALIPTPGSNFASAETPIEQVANDLIKSYKNIPTIHLDSYKQFTISDTPGYYLGISENQQGIGPVIIDNFIVVSGGLMYDIRYTVPQSLYNQNIPTRDLILDTIAVGYTYEKEVVPDLNIIKSSEATISSSMPIDINKMTYCMGNSVAHFHVGEPEWEVYDPYCDQTYLIE